MKGVSLLYAGNADTQGDTGFPSGGSLEMPEYVVDLNIDQIINGILKSPNDSWLRSIFLNPLRNIQDIIYRQQIVRDLDCPSFLRELKEFSSLMGLYHRYIELSVRFDFPLYKESWFYEAIRVYIQAVQLLGAILEKRDLVSPGLLHYRAELLEYGQSEDFAALCAAAEKLEDSFGDLHFSVYLRGLKVTVQPYGGEQDYNSLIKEVFSSFYRESEGGESARKFIPHPPAESGFDSVQREIIRGLATLYPKVFAQLDTFYQSFQSHVHEAINTFDRELRFYTSYFDYIGDLRALGLHFSLPEISETKKDIHALDFFDLALAKKLLAPKVSNSANATAIEVPVTDSSPGLAIVFNDFYFRAKERIFVITGPNQGGKTTFGRAFGQLHVFACLGLPVPCREGRLFLFDRVYTHFEKEESVLRGRLHGELIRIYQDLREATDKSIFILNEVFTSTTLEDSLFLSRKILEKIQALDAIGIFVTFLDELASMGDSVVSLMSQVNKREPSERTFKVLRQEADGLAYAISLAEKHGVTYHALRSRLGLS